MRGTIHIEKEAIDYGALVSLAKEKLKSGDQIDRALTESQLDAVAQGAFDEYKERFQGVAKLGKDKLRLETFFTIRYHLSVIIYQSYSPELNPVEQCWQTMKNVFMVNFVPLS